VGNRRSGLGLLGALALIYDYVFLPSITIIYSISIFFKIL
jgi:hypothetical protein